MRCGSGVGDRGDWVVFGLTALGAAAAIADMTCARYRVSTGRKRPMRWAQMLYEHTLGHDSRLDGIDFDAVMQTASVRVLAYPEPNASERVAITILFKDVESFAVNADLASLANNRSAGNVNHWHIADGGGTSHIYLTEGYIMISSRSAPEMVRR